MKFMQATKVYADSIWGGKFETLVSVQSCSLFEQRCRCHLIIRICSEQWHIRKSSMYRAHSTPGQSAFTMVLNYSIDKLNSSSFVSNKYNHNSPNLTFWQYPRMLMSELHWTGLEWDDQHLQSQMHCQQNWPLQCCRLRRHQHAISIYDIHNELFIRRITINPPESTLQKSQLIFSAQIQ